MDISAIEDAFIRGDWADVLLQSRERLLEHVAATTLRENAMTHAEEALVSMYLQSVFELARQEEVETAEMLMRSLAPLPFHVSLQWIKFLIAMDSKSMALELLNESLQQCATELTTSSNPSDVKERYTQLTELLVFHVLLPNDNPKVVRDYVTGDAVLDDATKQRILEAAHASTTSPPQETTPPHIASSASRSIHGGTQSTASASVSTREHVSAARMTDAQEADPSSDLVAIGGTALAMAAVAIGVYRYRDSIRDAVAEIGPAVSKGLADAKYALFES